jgi:hypothetical protein
MRSLFLLLLIPAFAQAQLPPIKLTVDPAPETKPSLRYELLPTGRDRVAGNAVLHYLKAHANMPAAERDPAKLKAESETVIRWEEATPDKLPTKEVAEYLKRYKSLFRELEYGARCKTCDWTSAPAAGTEAIDATLGNVQANRELARWLSLRCKLELAENRIADALRTIQTGLQFGRHVAEGPSMISMLVGNAIVHIFFARLDSLLEKPDAPNLYWALSVLPKPFLDPRPGLDGEDRVGESFLPGLVELQKGPVGAERALELTLLAMKSFQQISDGGGLSDIALKLALVARAEVVHAEARKELIARGRSAKEVGAMAPVQAAFLNSFERYRDLADDYRKWFLLGGPDSPPGVEKIADRVKRLKVDAKDDLILQVFLMVLPAMEKVFQSLVRTERRIAQLRTIEAIRLHAALEGHLPRELSEIKKVPVPGDPGSGKPFEYAVTEGGFTLTSPDIKSFGHLKLTYDVTLRAKK